MICDGLAGDQVSGFSGAGEAIESFAVLEARLLIPLLPQLSQLCSYRRLLADVQISDLYQNECIMLMVALFSYENGVEPDDRATQHNCVNTRVNPGRKRD